MSHTLNVLLLLASLLWTLLITALMGNVIATNINGHLAAVNFTMFVAVLSWLAVIVGLAAAFFASLARPMLLIPLYAAVAVFSLIDGIVLAAELRATNCGNISKEHLPKDWIGWGSHNDEKRCREIQASTAFMWFLWACFSASLFFVVREARSGFGGSVLSSRPSMSQVSGSV